MAIKNFWVVGCTRPDEARHNGRAPFSSFEGAFNTARSLSLESPKDLYTVVCCDSGAPPVDVAHLGNMELLESRKLQRALTSMVECVSSTGGVRRCQDGRVSPVADEDWLDLGEAYLEACEVLGVEPVVEEGELER